MKLSDCVEINTAVRAYFKKGLKSSNKMHTITDQDMAVANKTSPVLGQKSHDGESP